MILRIEIKEILNNFDISLMLIDTISKNIIHIKNNSVIKNEKFDINSKQIEDIVNKYVIYWNKKYINNKVIDGSESEIIILTTEGTIKYQFINKYPSNYSEFIKTIKSMVDIV